MNNARYLEGLSWEDELSLVAHELAHILWFSSGLF